jgi:hypothetical protein
MFDTLAATRTALEVLAREFEPRTLTGEQSVRMVGELGAIRRLVDALVGQAAMRVEETAAHKQNGKSERDAAQLVARAVGAEASEARRAIGTAKKSSAATCAATSRSTTAKSTSPKAGPLHGGTTTTAARPTTA